MTSKLLLPFFMLGTFVMMFIVHKTGTSLMTSSTPLGILDLEFACSKEKADQVIQAWVSTEQGTISNAKKNTYWDFGFLIFYTPFLFLLLKKVSHTLRNPVWLRSVARKLAPAALLAGFLDIIENTGILLTLNGKVSTVAALITFIPALIKWMLVICIITFLLFALPYRWIYRRGQP